MAAFACATIGCLPESDLHKGLLVAGYVGFCALSWLIWRVYLRNEGERKAELAAAQAEEERAKA